MTRVVLIRPAYSEGIYGEVYRSNKTSMREVRPPLGLMAMSGYLKARGHDVFVVDGEPELLSREATVRQALAHEPDVVGISSTTPEYPFAFQIISDIKRQRPGVVTVFGGAHITNLPEHTIADLGDAIDWGVLYEGERPLAAIVEGQTEHYRWRGDRSEKLLMAHQRLTAAELNAFEPDRTCVDMRAYRFVDTSLGLVQNDAVEMARGCPFGCAFCTSRRTTMAARSIEATVREIVGSVQAYGTKLVMFFDDTFTLNRNRAEALFREIIDQKNRGRIPQNVHFSGFTRANTLDMELVELMKRAGFDKISIGIETGDAAILHAMQKGTVLDDYRQAYGMLEAVGISKRGSFIVGHPYETEETIRASIDFAIELDLDEIGVNVMTPYPGQLTFRDAMQSRGIWFSHPIHYEGGDKDPSGTQGIWEDYRGVNWHDYWKDHLRWGKSVVETETLSGAALIYWHGRFLQEVYGAEAMQRRRLRQIEAGNRDEYWHRPWKVHSDRNRERLETEKLRGKPQFAEPLHRSHRYTPLPLRDYQKNELHLSEARKKRQPSPEQYASQP